MYSRGVPLWSPWFSPCGRPGLVVALVALSCLPYNIYRKQYIYSATMIMDKISTGFSGIVTSDQSWTLDSRGLIHHTLGLIHHTLLERTLQTALERATHTGRAVLASMTQAMTWYDPLDAFAGCLLSSLGESFFWERPSESTALVGIGAATTIETRGEARFHEAAARWRALMQDAVVAQASDVVPIAGSGPTLFGGFAFDALAPRTDLWHDFPDGLLVLPSLLFSYGPQGVALTVNVMVDVNENIEQRVAECSEAITHLLTSVEYAASHHEEQVVADELRTRDLLSALEWKQHVADVAREIRAGRYEKVVLARGVKVTPQDVMELDGIEFDIRGVLRRLRRSYPGAYVFAMQRGQRFFAGATPERLVQAQDGNIYTMALAGTAPRGATPEEDERIGKSLLQSDKNNIEHAIVVSQVRDALAQHCGVVEVADIPHLLKLKNVQHLETPVRGTLLPQRCILDVMADLHPTPAVGGFPRQLALETIRRVEQLDRGWYAGPLGWIGASGHGEFAVALRSGLVDEHEATLFAGCGIVGDSDPQSEYEESCLKLQVMLRSLSDTWKD